MGVIVIVELEAFAVALESFVKLEDFCVVYNIIKKDYS